MPQLIIKWLTKDGYEYETEQRAILHEECQEQIEEMSKVIRENSTIYLDPSDSYEIAWTIFGHYNVEKKNV